MYRPNSILAHVGKLSLPLKTILNYVGMTGEIQCRQLVCVLMSQTGISEFVLFPISVMKIFTRTVLLLKKYTHFTADLLLR